MLPDLAVPVSHRLAHRHRKIRGKPEPPSACGHSRLATGVAAPALSEGPGRMAGMRARRVTAASLLLALPALGGCSLLGSPPDPRVAAERVAEAVSGGQPAEVFGPAEGEEYDGIVAGLGEDLTPSVVAAEAEVSPESDAQAVATLRWTWPFPAGEWRYESQVAMRLVEDAWEPVWDPAVVEPSLVEGEVLAASGLDPARGRILGAGGRVSVGPRPVGRFGIDRGQVAAVPAARRSARRLARLVGVDVAPYAARVSAAGERAFVEAIVFRQEDVPPRVAASYDQIPGVIAVPGELPLAPTREFAAPILGAVGEVTAEIIEEDPDTYAVGDLAGLSGLQARYEEQLRGTPGLVVEAEPDGSSEGAGEPRELWRVEPEAGEDLRLTLAPRLQEVAEDVLSGEPSASALVALRPSTGEILAAANGPGTEGQNIATFGRYPPGSTFKIVSSLALLRSGLTPRSSVECPATAVVDGRRFGNYDDYPSGGLGTIPLATALANSCNTAFIGGRGRLERGSLADAAASLGLRVDHDVGFPAYFGQVPPAASRTEAAADMIGQGRVLVSPMALAVVMGSVVAGETVVPSLVEGVTSPVPDVAALGAGEARDLRTMLRGVVTSGSGVQLLDVPGPEVIAKTGTAEFGTEVPLQTHAWMVAGQGDLAVAVFVEIGQSGSSTAGPLLESFLRAARP